jgi:bacillithiol biosynthesis deacetylase BshB1
MMDRSADALVFGPHPDDAEIWSGGLIARLARLGYRVGIVDLTRGETGTRGSAEERLREAQEAARVLGAAFRENLGLIDGALAVEPASKRAVVEAIRRSRPAILIAPYPSDDHPDHANAGRIVEESLFLAGLRRFEADGEAHRPRQIWYYMCHEPIPTSFVVDISDVFERKLKAIRCFATQLHRPGSREPSTNISSPDFLDRIEARCRYFGSLVGADFGEPYHVKRPVRVEDPLAPWVVRRDGGERGGRTP